MQSFFKVSDLTLSFSNNRMAWAPLALEAFKAGSKVWESRFRSISLFARPRPSAGRTRAERTRAERTRAERAFLASFIDLYVFMKTSIQGVLRLKCKMVWYITLKD